MPNRRAYYRVLYPSADRPQFSAAAISGSVVDCSERGVRIAIVPTVSPPVQVGERLEATVRFRRGEVVGVEGQVLRVEPDYIVLALDRHPLPFGVILREQFWLRERYPFRAAEA